MKKMINKTILGLIISMTLSSAYADDASRNESCLNQKNDLALEIAKSGYGEEVQVLNLYTDVESEQMYFEAKKFIAGLQTLSTEEAVSSDDAIAMMFISRVRNDVHEGFVVSNLTVVSTDGDNLYTVVTEEFDAPSELTNTSAYMMVFSEMEPGQEIDYVSLATRSLYTSAWNLINASEIDMCAYLVIK